MSHSRDNERDNIADSRCGNEGVQGCADADSVLTYKLAGYGGGMV